MNAKIRDEVLRGGIPYNTAVEGQLAQVHQVWPLDRSGRLIHHQIFPEPH